MELVKREYFPVWQFPLKYLWKAQWVRQSTKKKRGEVMLRLFYLECRPHYRVSFCIQAQLHFWASQSIPKIIWTSLHCIQWLSSLNKNQSPWIGEPTTYWWLRFEIHSLFPLRKEEEETLTTHTLLLKRTFIFRERVEDWQAIEFYEVIFFLNKFPVLHRVTKSKVNEAGKWVILHNQCMECPLSSVLSLLRARERSDGILNPDGPVSRAFFQEGRRRDRVRESWKKGCLILMWF